MSTAVSCFTDRGGELLLRVRAKPRAGRDRVAGVRAGELVVEVRAAPERGKANEAIVRALAAALGVRRAEVVLLRGGGSPRKLFTLPREARAALERLEGG